MDTTRALHLLHEHRQGLSNQLTAAEAVVSVAGSDGGPALARAHWDLARLLRSYRLFKHAEVFCPAIAQGDTDERRSAADMMVNCDRAAARFDDYVLRFSGIGGTVPVGEPDRRAAMLALIAGIRAHLDNEGRAIERLMNDWRGMPVGMPPSQPAATSLYARR
ncbi:hypothetical protein [Sphingomonas sp. Leaf343]|uniref:hypothetical protein n=1 Tax=Sphingomonas sp. Leaf343 TaxID=1736345 RepID=UPI0006FD0ADB|nr:hypothetical protein [Sphingomonas sp. Leaf343]KQR87469.1 hypothetical protein ASG07_00655 [Sphingomonas sp. Leaf343]